MRDNFRLPNLIAIILLAVTASWNMALAQTPAPSWEESLSSQYPKGTVLNVLTTGVVGTTGCSNVHAISTFKEGKLHAPGFGQNLALATLKCEMQPIAPGTQVYLGEMKVYQKNNKVAFGVLQCSVGDCSGGVAGAVSAQVDFEFPKGFLATAQLAQVQEAIHHVFSAASSPNATTQGAQVAPAVSQPASPGTPPAVTMGSLYVNAQKPADKLRLNVDGTLFLVQGGKGYSGTFTIEGDKLTLRIGGRGVKSTSILQGDTMIDPGGEKWVRQAPEPAAAVPMIAPAALGSLYVNAQDPADRIQLNPDGSFSLQEGGQPFSGAYSVAGTTLKLHIIELQKDAEIAINGDSLIVNGAENWVQPAPPLGSTAGSKGSTEKASGSVLRNQDIIKMAQAGLDDSIIISKIKSSRCQFDTSPDTLIELKKSGISSAVLKAMTDAANP